MYVCNVHTCVCTKVCVYVYVMSISAAVCGLLVCLAVCESVYTETQAHVRGEQGGRGVVHARVGGCIYIHTNMQISTYMPVGSFCSVT